MKKIYKYKMSLIEKQIVQLPLASEVLDIQSQHGEIYLWALVDPESTLTFDREFHIFGTGYELDIDNLKHISTFQTQGGDLVWHAFERLMTWKPIE